MGNKPVSVSRRLLHRILLYPLLLAAMAEGLLRRVVVGLTSIHARRILLVLIVLLLVIGMLFASINAQSFPGWTGISSYEPPTENKTREKTVWDWLDLIIVPLVVSLTLFWLNASQKKREENRDEKRQQQETKRQVDNQHQDTLRDYFDKMSELLLDEHLGDEIMDRKTNNSKAAIIARARTLAVLRSLDPARVAAVLLFLREAQLTETVPLEGGNLQEVDWSKANLYRADLRGADLFKARLYRAYLREADLREAKLLRVYLVGADLRGTDLRGADLRGAVLGSADLEGAKFDDFTSLPPDFNPQARGMVYIATKRKQVVKIARGFRKLLRTDLHVGMRFK